MRSLKRGRAGTETSYSDTQIRNTLTARHCRIHVDNPTNPEESEPGLQVVTDDNSEDKYAVLQCVVRVFLFTNAVLASKDINTFIYSIYGHYYNVRDEIAVYNIEPLGWHQAFNPT